MLQLCFSLELIILSLELFPDQNQQESDWLLAWKLFEPGSLIIQAK
jgi:hypothetical protein